MVALISVIGSDIFYENHHVGALKPDLWATLHDSVASHMEGTDGALMPFDEHEEKILELEREQNKAIEELEGRVKDLEDERDLYITRCEQYENEEGVADELADLRAENERLKARNADLTRALKALQAPAKATRRAPRKRA